MSNGEIVKVTVLAPRKLQEEIWRVVTASGRKEQSISRFYVQAAEERLAKVTKRVKRATR